RDDARRRGLALGRGLGSRRGAPLLPIGRAGHGGGDAGGVPDQRGVRRRRPGRPLHHVDGAGPAGTASRGEAAGGRPVPLPPRRRWTTPSPVRGVALTAMIRRLGPGDEAVVLAGADLFDRPPTPIWT